MDVVILVQYTNNHKLFLVEKLIFSCLSETYSGKRDFLSSYLRYTAASLVKIPCNNMHLEHVCWSDHKKNIFAHLL